MLKSIPFWIIATLAMFFFFNQFQFKNNTPTLVYSDFVSEVQQNRVRKVTIDGITIYGESNDGRKFEVSLPSISDPKLIDDLLAHKVIVEGVKPTEPSIFRQLLIATLPILITMGLLMYFFKLQGLGGKGGAMSFGKNQARLLDKDKNKTTFADVAGIEEAKEDVAEIVDFLSFPAKFSQVGGSVPKGILLVGSPGTGKTLLAKAIAGEANVPFFSISGSDFVEMFVGVGASRVREMFSAASKKAPCIIFIDEIDAVGRHRGAGLGGGHDEREQTLNQLLVEMDGFTPNQGIIIIAATNRPDVLDPALLRPGRFDRQVVVPLPDIKGRKKILDVHMAKVAVVKNIDSEILARGTPGFSGADLANLVNEAAICAVRHKITKITMREFELAKDKILMGSERKSMVMSDDEKKNTAYHESGHAIVGLTVPEHDPVYKVTIIPRGRALGVTMFLPVKDRYSNSKTAIESQLASLFGGRIAEELILGKDGITTGASNDIERATAIARDMVCKWGLSDLGPIYYDQEEGEIFLGRSSGRKSIVSAETAKNIDKEINKIVDKCYAAAKNILTANLDKLHIMAAALVEFETIEDKHIQKIMAGISLSPKDFVIDQNATTTDNATNAKTATAKTKNNADKSSVDKSNVGENITAQNTAKSNAATDSTKEDVKDV